MNNRIQQRFDRSIAKAVEETKQAWEKRPRKAVKPLPEEPQPKLGRMVLLMDPETGGTVLVPYNHPLAVAKRRQLRASADRKPQP